MCLDPDPLLADIEAFLARHRYSAARFGQEAVNDSALVLELRKGRELKRATRRRILQFIARFCADAC